MSAHELRRLRQSVQLSQRQLARAVGVTGAAISQAERGLTQLTEEHERAIRAFVSRYSTARLQFERSLSAMREPMQPQNVLHRSTD